MLICVYHIVEEAQSTVCELTERNRHNQETLLETSRQINTFEAQIQTLKIEKSNLSAELHATKKRLENHENDTYE